MPLTIPSNAQTFNVSPVAVSLPWAFEGTYYYTEGAGATSEWKWGLDGIPAGWSIYQARMGILVGTSPGVGETVRLAAWHTNFDIGIGGGTAYNGTFNDINHQADTGLCDVGTVPITIAQFDAVRFRVIAGGGAFAYHRPSPNIAQVVAAPTSSRPQLIL